MHIALSFFSLARAHIKVFFCIFLTVSHFRSSSKQELQDDGDEEKKNSFRRSQDVNEFALHAFNNQFDGKRIERCQVALAKG